MTDQKTIEKFSLKELAQEADLKERTIRYYIQEGAAFYQLPARKAPG